MVMPGETYDYTYDTSKQNAGAMCFYHCHIHGLTAEQYWAGLAGRSNNKRPQQCTLHHTKPTLWSLKTSAYLVHSRLPTVQPWII